MRGELEAIERARQLLFGQRSVLERAPQAAPCFVDFVIHWPTAAAAQGWVLIQVVSVHDTALHCTLGAEMSTGVSQLPNKNGIGSVRIQPQRDTQ